MKNPIRSKLLRFIHISKFYERNSYAYYIVVSRTLKFKKNKSTNDRTMKHLYMIGNQMSSTITLYTQHNNFNKRSGSVKSVKCHTTFVQSLESKKHNIASCWVT